VGRELLNQLRIAAPCPASWQEMEGDDRVRFCRLCSLNVYNIRDMTDEEAERLISESGGKVCLRLYRRSDGTVLTKNCPVGVRHAAKRVIYAAAVGVALLLSSFGLALARLRGEAHDRNLLIEAKESARNWPVVGKVIDHFDPGTVVGRIMPIPTVGGSPSATGSGP